MSDKKNGWTEIFYELLKESQGDVCEVLLPSIEDSGLDSWADDKRYIEFLENEMTS
jgi:hypothetical protein